MNGRTGILGIALAGISFFPHNSYGVDVYSDPAGFITLTIAGTNGSPPGTTSKLSYLGLGMTQFVVKPGRVTSAVTNELVDANAAWATDQFNGANGPHFIEITSGSFAGTIDDIVKTVGSTKKIYTANNLVSLGLPNIVNQTYRIRKHWTIAGVFGAANAAGLAGGAGAASADNILVPDGSGGFTTFFYKNVNIPPGSGIGWRKSDNLTLDASVTKLYIDQSVLVRRKQASSIALKLVGSVKFGQTIVPVETSNNFVGNVYPASVTLSNSGLYTASSTTGVAPGAGAASADTVLIDTPSGLQTFFFKNVNIPPGSGTGWRRSDDLVTDRGSTLIPLGAGFIIQRKSPRPAFDWKSPQPFVNN